MHDRKAPYGEPSLCKEAVMPEETDNSVRPEDGAQDVSQDPNVRYCEDGTVEP